MGGAAASSGAGFSGRFGGRRGSGDGRFLQEAGEPLAESSRQTRAKYPNQNTTPGVLLSSRIYPYTINVRTRPKNLNSRSEAQRTGKEGRESRAAEKSKTAPLENHKGCGTPSYFCTEILVERNSSNSLRHPPCKGRLRETRVQRVVRCTALDFL
jgi:hypothetical protein